MANILIYLTHRIIYAVTEGWNAKIQWIEYSLRSCRDRERLTLAIDLHRGSRDLEPCAEKILSTVPPHYLLQSRKARILLFRLRCDKRVTGKVPMAREGAAVVFALEGIDLELA